MPTIATTVFPDEAYVLVEVDWSDYPDVEYARVWRINTVTGEEVLLRPYVAYNGDGDLLLSCSLGVWWDTDPPQDVVLQYRTEAAAVLTNAATNPSFESGTAPWTAVGGALTQSGVFAHDGVFSGLLTPTGGVFASTVAQTGIAITPEVAVTASGWVLTPQGWNTIRLELRWFNGAIQVGTTQQSNIEILDDAEWRYMTLTATPPAEALTASLTVQVSGSAPNTTLFYMDELEVAQPVTQTAYALSGDVTVDGTADYYLKDPINPCGDRGMSKCMPGPQACVPTSAMMVLTPTNAREAYDSHTVVLRPVNRRRPVPQIREGGDAATSLVVITRTFGDRDLLKETLRPGTILFLQGPAEQGFEDRYLTRGQYTIDAPVRDHRVQPRLFTIPYEVVDRPEDPMNGPCGIRVDDLCDIYSSWAAMNIAGIEWGQLLLGAASYSSPGVDTTGWRTFDDVNAEFADFNAVDDGVRTFTDLLEGN